jgi:hypothetical protein
MLLQKAEASLAGMGETPVKRKTRRARHSAGPMKTQRRFA